MAATLAVELSAKQIKAMLVCGTDIAGSKSCHLIKQFPRYDCFVGIMTDYLSLFRIPGLPFSFAIDDFRFQACQGTGIDLIVQNVIHRCCLSGVWLIVGNSTVSSKALSANLELVGGRGKYLPAFQLVGNGNSAVSQLGKREDLQPQDRQ